ncbi:MAG TPA: UDP-N-acetylglucosamine 2-epimerase (non-hydrolyzing) [Anaerolineae bacterium]
MRVLCIFGTRPEAVKMAPVVKQLRRHPDRITTRVWVTAQHREMLDQVLQLFNIEPDLDLDLMRNGQTPSQVAGLVLQRLEPHLMQERPDWVVVQGDTTTAMATAIAAHHLQIGVAHVEAGLRTHDKRNPFPEEMNRIVVDAISDLHLAPTDKARLNLLREGIPEASIRVTGNTVIDALLDVAGRPWVPPAGSPLASLASTGESNPRLILVTAHRRESFGQPMRDICVAMREIADKRGDQVRILFPVHLNPNVQEPVYQILGNLGNVTLLPPLDYQSMVYLMKRSYLVLTDSGGLQEEAPSLGKPVLVLRETTERPEAVEAGTARVVGTNPDQIVSATMKLLDDNIAYSQMAHAVNPFGDGHAAERIVAALMETRPA